MVEIFPPHFAEEQQIYQQRIQRSTYIPYAGQIIDFFVSALTSDPIKVVLDPEPSDNGYYHDLIEDTTPRGGKRVPLNSFVADQVRCALIHGCAWTLVDLPRMPDPDEKQGSLLDQIESGALNAYLVSLAPENVLDWEQNEQNQLDWAIVRNVVHKRADITAVRDVTREEYIYYTKDEWKLYAIEYKAGDEPTDETEVPLEAEGRHSFGVVPIVPFELPEGLHAMAKIENLAINHFNKQSALDWAQYRTLFAFVVAKLGDNTTAMTPHGDDPNRATNQKMGTGRVVVMGSEDSMEYVSPPSEPFKIALETNNVIRDEMYRVANAMALSVDNSGGALKRSAQSKAIDMSAMAIVMKKLGSIARDHVMEVFSVIMKGRGEMDASSVSSYDLTVTGYENFDELSMTEFLQEVATIKDLNVPSAKFQQMHQYAIAKRCLPGVDDDDLAIIKDELEKNVSNEQFLPPPILGDAEGAMDTFAQVKGPTVPDPAKQQ